VLASLQILLLATVIASFAYWSLPAAWVEGRRAVLLATSGVLIFIYNPGTLVLAVLTAVLAWILYGLAKRHPRRGWIPWLVATPLVVDAIIPLGRFLEVVHVGSPRSPLLESLVTLGLSFYTGLKAGDLPYRELLTTTLFYPAFPMGPIDASQKFDRAALSRAPDVRRWVMGVGRIGIGVLKIYVLGAWIKGDLAVQLFGVPMERVHTVGWSGPVEALLFAFVAFGYLYVNFSGFTDIAIGSGWMFNLDLTENFRFPLISHSIQNFWQRWHLSLSRFITMYMFKPLLRRTGRTALSLVVTFTLIGLWHEVSVGYVLWGLGHGGLLALTAWYRGLGRRPIPMPWFVRRGLGIAITLSIVSVLSTMANQPSNRALVDYLAAFAGVRL
jgi:alginate O-acetyltransferase complex protein AlgI